MLDRARLLLVGAALLAAAPAHAESRAWAAAKQVLPAGLTQVAGIKLGKLKSSQLYEIGVKQVAEKLHLDKLKATCGFNPMANVDSMVLVGSGAPELVVLAFTKLGRKKLEPCIQKSEAKELSIRWLADDIAAVATGADQLTRLTAGGFAKDTTIAPLVGKLSTDSAGWIVTNKTAQLGGGATMSAAYGTLAITPPDMSVDLHMVVDSAQAAAASAAALTSKLDTAKQHLPTATPHALDRMTVRAAGKELIIAGPFPENALVSIAMTLAVTP